MRPSKYVTEGIAIMQKLLNTSVAAQCLTDKEIFDKMNELLGEGKHICYRTYQRYKAAAKAFGEETVEKQQQFDPVFRELYHTISLNQIKQKENLYKALLEAEGSEWHKYKWILERKFADFNLRYAS